MYLVDFANLPSQQIGRRRRLPGINQKFHGVDVTRAAGLRLQLVDGHRLEPVRTLACGCRHFGLTQTNNADRV
jgi:hypothetical protein